MAIRPLGVRNSGPDASHSAPPTDNAKALGVSPGRLTLPEIGRMFGGTTGAESASLREYLA
jgi:hypothetical protein